MKKILFVDDKLNVDDTPLHITIDELNKIFTEDHVENQIDIETIQCAITRKYLSSFDENGELNDLGKSNKNLVDDVQAVSKKVNELAESLIQSNDPHDKVEIVMDVCFFPGAPDTRFSCGLIKYIINRLNENPLYTKLLGKKMLITISSIYILALDENMTALQDYYNKKYNNFIKFCYLPIKRIHNTNKYKLFKNLDADPIFYNDYKIPDTDPKKKINILLYDKKDDHTGTSYGNFFGLIYARLFNKKGK